MTEHFIRWCTCLILLLVLLLLLVRTTVVRTLEGSFGIDALVVAGQGLGMQPPLVEHVSFRYSVERTDE